MSSLHPLRRFHFAQFCRIGRQSESMRPARNPQGGFSIVEVLIASMVLSIVVVAVVGLIQKSGEIRIESNHRITARAIINRQLEQRYHSKMFNALSDMESVETLTIDSRTGEPLYGNMSTKIESDSATCAGNMEVPVKKVTISVSWNEYNDVADSVSVSRWLVP